jgi:hypothetical protein
MKLVVMGNGMAAHKPRKESTAVSPMHRQHIGECIEVLGDFAQWGDGAQVPVR